MVGLLWAILVMLTIVAVWFMIWSVYDVTQPGAPFQATGWAARLAVVVSVVPLVLVLYILVLKIVCHDDIDLVLSPWFLKLVMGLLIQAFLISAIVGLFILFKPVIKGEGQFMLSPEEPLPEKIGSSRMLVLVVVMAASVGFGLLGLFSYTALVFPEIPREWGGGAKPVVELFLREKLPVFADREDIPSTLDGKRIGPVICVLETDRVLVVAPLNTLYTQIHHETVALDRSAVTAVAYEGRYSSSSTSVTPVAALPNPTPSPRVAH